MASHMEDESRVTTPMEAGKPDDEYVTSRKSKFRFKSKSKRSSERHERSRSPRSEHHDNEHRRHRRRRRLRRPSPTSAAQDDPSLYDDTYLPNTSREQFLDPEIAFRESLFDAMADDEGAQFWEGVYGQPIHTFPNARMTPLGELEMMTDEEYTAFVRAKMYEKTHQHLIEEKARRDAARVERARSAREGRQAEEEAKRFQRKVEESLKRGERRRSRKEWSDKWDTYTKRWEVLGKGGVTSVIAATIPWPVESGSVKDIGKEQIERFFLHAPSGGGEPMETQIKQTLKQERVRWHPDKIQQKLGGQDVDEGVLQSVTAVFQIIDRMWREARDGMDY